MREKTILRLFLLIVLSISLYSCVHDEISSSSDPYSKEYSSKSPVKEDEVYIKNVMKVFEQYGNKDYFANNFGTISWDYAVTMGTHESFLEVPVIKNNKVNLVLFVYKEGNRIFFKRKDEEDSKQFFNALVFNDRKNLKNATVNNSLSDKGGCISMTITWTWTNEDGSAGPTYTFVTMGCLPSGPSLPCQAIDENANCGGSTGGNTGGGSSSGGGGGGYPYPQTPQTPCDKVLDVLSKPGVQPKIKELKDQSTQGGEKGVKFKIDGTPSPTITGGAHSVNLGDKTGYTGGYHNHTPTGIPMLSPPDIDQLLGFARAQPTSNPTNVNNAYLGMIAPNGMHYVIWFNGTYQDAIKTFSQDDLDVFGEDYRELASDLTTPLLYGQTYRNSDGSINNLGVEKLFFTTLKKMGLEGKVNLQRIEDNGIIQNINLDSNNTPNAVPCS
ncbi:hypothetical protein SAMN05421664_3395 [Chryseobacterium soldanellicola]|uniref:Uncharacterized protein n=1 Tax=Chryseobacterium soldanellicola TaxID=311333 RepID=A0A1H1G1G3_9FLAO|nr:hypothetical protein [Chryseobacterium soldanellicola]SDR07077.1 hypothetical protein SAMN05421664_3395 [Chryseobacterium soldanellicola]